MRISISKRRKASSDPSPAHLLGHELRSATFANSETSDLPDEDIVGSNGFRSYMPWLEPKSSDSEVSPGLYCSDETIPVEREISVLRLA